MEEGNKVTIVLMEEPSLPGLIDSTFRMFGTSYSKVPRIPKIITQVNPGRFQDIHPLLDDALKDAVPDLKGIQYHILYKINTDAGWCVPSIDWEIEEDSEIYITIKLNKL